MNRVLAQDPGGTTRFAGTLNEAAKVTIQSKSATVAADNQFSGTATLASGTNTVDVQATDYSGNVRTNTYQVNVSGTTKSFTHDANGNMTGDGTRTFEWDAENRLIAVNNGTHRTEFTYDGRSRRVRIIEKDNSITTSDVRFLWCEIEICEERDSTGTTTTKRFFPQGTEDGSSDFFYTRDNLGSIREMTDSSAALRARYEYDPYGRSTKISGDKDSPFGFTGHFPHSASGLVLTLYRAYDPAWGRWISQDPLAFGGGDINLYRYALDSPAAFIDMSGQMAVPISGAGWQSLSNVLKWALGSLTPTTYGPGSGVSQDLRNTPAMGEIRAQYKKNGCKSGMYCGDYQYYEVALTTSITGQLVGAFCAYLTNLGGGQVAVDAQNTWGLESGSRLPSLPWTPRGSNRKHASVQQMLSGQRPIQWPKSILEDKKSGPMRPVTIHYQWQESIPCCGK